MRRRAVLVALLAMVATLSVVVPASVAGQQGTPDSGESGNYTLEELKEGGPTVSNAPPSVRLGERKQWWVVHWPASAINSNPGEDGQWAHLKPGGRVTRNAVYLRTIQFEESETRQVHVVTWTKGTKTVKRGNTTTEVPVARNVTESVRSVTLSRGWPMVKVPLRQHNQPVQVTMWVEGAPSARWRFEHKSVATTQNAGIKSEGDYLARVATDFLVPFLIGGFLVGFLVDRAIDRAGIGPQLGLLTWFIGLTVLTAGVTLFWTTSLADLLVKAPTILAVYAVGVVGIVMLETMSRGLQRVEFEKPDVETAVSPSGENAVDYRATETRTEKVLQRPDGKRAVVRRGLLPFLARVWGRMAILENDEKVATRVKDTGPSSTDERVLVDPDAEEVLDYKPEGWTLSWRYSYHDEDGEKVTDTEWSALGVVAALTVGAVAVVGAFTAAPDAGVVTMLTSGPALGVGAVTAIIGSLEATDGHAKVEPAPAHFRSAHASVAYLVEELEDARLLDEARDQLRRERIRSQQDVEEALDDLDRTLVEEAFDVDVGRRVDDGDGRDPARHREEVEPGD